MSKEITNNDKILFNDIRQLIEDARSNINRAVNIGMTITYWNIGRLINEDILKKERGEYGKAIIATLSQLLTEEYGRGYSKSALTRMCKFHTQFEDRQIVATLSQQLSWSHFVEIIFVVASRGEVDGR